MGDPSVKAIVTYPSQDGSVNWKMEDVSPLEPREHELCVQVVACGICHTDLVASLMPPERVNYPIVLGHEGELRNPWTSKHFLIWIRIRICY
jgi:D-arabinose 1-dehydrogenase-like Zn-dependent alcohol dehydrogenase